MRCASVLHRPGSWLGILVLTVSLSGCAAALKEDPPSPDRPQISALQLAPRQLSSGCRVTVTFRFEDPHSDVARVRAYWTRRRGTRTLDSGLTALEVDPRSFTGKQTGTVTGWLTLLQPGQYWYAVQVEDAAGRKSNVLEDSLIVYAQPPSGPNPCN